MLQGMRNLGSKAASGAWQAIVAALPPHDTYIETHLGTGTVMLRKPPAARSIGIDLDGAPLAHFAAPFPVELVHGDAAAFLKGFDFAGAGRVMIYADPPYLPETRSSRTRYRHEYSRQDHVRLLALLKSLPAAVAISGYPSALYDDLLAGWRTLEFQVMTRGGIRTEKLWMNYPADAAYWATYAGKDFTDRQRIKRKAARWAENYRNLSAGERLAVLSALLETESHPE